MTLKFDLSADSVDSMFDGVDDSTRVLAIFFNAAVDGDILTVDAILRDPTFAPSSELFPEIVEIVPQEHQDAVLVALTKHPNFIRRPQFYN